MSGARANAAAIQRRVNKTSNIVTQHAIPDNSSNVSGKTNISVSKAISIMQKSIIELQNKHKNEDEHDNNEFINEEIRVLNDKLTTLNNNFLILKKENNELKEIVKGLQQLTNTMNSKILSMS